MFGKDYILEHVISEANKRTKQEMYEVYMSDIGLALVSALGAKGVKRYYDYIHQDKQESKPADEIVQDISRRAGLTQKGGGEHD